MNREGKTPATTEAASDSEITDILEEIEIEDLTVDGICGVY